MNKRILIIIGIAVAVVIISVVIMVRRQRNQTTVNSAKISKTEQIKQQIKVSLTTALKTDKDLDGLSDVDEKKIGTDPNNDDTDHDGLSDYDEVKVYQTNPLKADTYGVGYMDGWLATRRLISAGGRIDLKQLENWIKK